jgi:hypothetical protein
MVNLITELDITVLLYLTMYDLRFSQQWLWTFLFYVI